MDACKHNETEICSDCFHVPHRDWQITAIDWSPVGGFLIEGVNLNRRPSTYGYHFFWRSGTSYMVDSPRYDASDAMITDRALEKMRECRIATCACLRVHSTPRFVGDDQTVLACVDCGHIVDAGSWGPLAYKP